MAHRVLDVLHEMCMSAARALVIVAHAGPLRVIAGQLSGLPRSQWLAIPFGYGRATRIDFEQGYGRTVWSDR